MPNNNQLSLQNKEKILIIIRGGVVQNIFGSSEDILIDILDFDDLACEPDIDAEKLYREKTNELTVIY